METSEATKAMIRSAFARGLARYCVKSMGAQLREIRRQKKISQDKIANNLYISQGTISRIENSQLPMNRWFNYFFTILNELDVSLDCFSLPSRRDQCLHGYSHSLVYVNINVINLDPRKVIHIDAYSVQCLEVLYEHSVGNAWFEARFGAAGTYEDTRKLFNKLLSEVVNRTGKNLPATLERQEDWEKLASQWGVAWTICRDAIDLRWP